MEVRGSVIRGINAFVEYKHREGYDEWKNALTKESVNLLETASNSSWYDVQTGVIGPTEEMCKRFYKSPKEGAWESGRYSAKVGLTGIYKIFVLVATPAFMLKRASRVIATYYRPTQLEVTDSSDKSMVISFTELPIKNELIEYRIAGWMEQALEICGCKNWKLDIAKSIAKGDDSFIVDIKWD